MFEYFFSRYVKEVDGFRERSLDKIEIAALSLMIIVIIFWFVKLRNCSPMIILILTLLMGGFTLLYSRKIKKIKNSQYKKRMDFLINLLKKEKLYTIHHIDWLIFCYMPSTKPKRIESIINKGTVLSVLIAFLITSMYNVIIKYLSDAEILKLNCILLIVMGYFTIVFLLFNGLLSEIIGIKRRRYIRLVQDLEHLKIQYKEPEKIWLGEDRYHSC